MLDIFPPFVDNTIITSKQLKRKERERDMERIPKISNYLAALRNRVCCDDAMINLYYNCHTDRWYRIEGDQRIDVDRCPDCGAER